MKRCVIVGGAPIGDYERVRTSLREEDFFIFCDCGLRHLEPLGVRADLIVGDFDSFPRPDTGAETIVLPCEKDDTDTVYAMKEALRRGFEDFLLVGMTGGRMDHTLGNLSMLLYLEARGKRALLLDDFSRMRLVPREGAAVEEGCLYFSLLSLSPLSEGITIRGAEYPLTGGSISWDYPYGISNRVRPGGRAEIFAESGKLLLITVDRE